MKLLKIAASGLPLFGGRCEIDFFAGQRVSADSAEKMSCILSNGSQKYYQNDVMSFIGINASGKTTVLKLIAFVCRMLNNEPLNSIDCREVLDGLCADGKAEFDVFFTRADKVNMLHTVVMNKGGRLIIADESLKAKLFSRITGKQDIFRLDKYENVMSRNNNEVFLLDDVSIMVALNKRDGDQLIMTDMLRYTNVNSLSLSEDCPPELIAFFDPSIETLTVKGTGNETDIRLKFRKRAEIRVKQLSELDRYLSSGTIKGINIFLNAVKAFETGGYLIIDELENHFNHEIVSTLIRFYMDKKINPNGAVLIFSTHYSELLDEFDRNDNIFIVRNRNGITVDNLSGLLDRNDIKKSEAYKSDFLEGTAPVYDAYMNLKKSIIGFREVRS